MFQDHAWSHTDNDKSNEDSWAKETTQPTGYQYWPEKRNSILPPAFVQKATYPSKDSSSYIEPYVIREHAWSHDDFDKSNEQSWDKETKEPSGYQVKPTDAFAQKNT